MDKKALLFEMIRKRSEKSFSDGGDGFVFASMLAFDVGLNSRIVKGCLILLSVMGFWKWLGEE
ncbi:hypothetical protein [Escherichia coli]|uniref:hypothetical protein n=1 Tax=Escherichia coli TaxID=562 RepID=UPI001C19F1E5|nr:hypothetical protein [Escherichia coli]HCW2988277.1 hypothetical protein [Escherichia coli]